MKKVVSSLVGALALFASSSTYSGTLETKLTNNNINLQVDSSFTYVLDGSKCEKIPFVSVDSTRKWKNCTSNIGELLEQDLFIEVNGDKKLISSGSELTTYFFGYENAKIINEGDENVVLRVSESLNSDDENNAVLSSVEISPKGSVSVERFFSLDDKRDQFLLPNYTITGSDLSFNFKKELKTGERHNLVQIVSSPKKASMGFESVNVLVDEFTWTDANLRIHDNGGYVNSVFLFHPSTWGGLEQKSGVKGEFLEEVFNYRSGALIIGNADYIASKVTKNENLTRGVVIKSRNLSDKKMYVRYGIRSNDLVSASSRKIVEFELPHELISENKKIDISKLSINEVTDLILSSDYQFHPFSLSIKNFNIKDNSEIEFKEEVITTSETGKLLNFLERNKEFGGDERVVSVKKIELRELINDIYEKDSNKIRNIAREIKTSSMHYSVSFGLNMSDEIVNGRLVRGESSFSFRGNSDLINLGKEFSEVGLSDIILSTDDFTFEFDKAIFNFGNDAFFFNEPIDGELYVADFDESFLTTMFPSKLRYVNGEHIIPFVIKNREGEYVLSDASLYLILSDKGIEDSGIKGIILPEITPQRYKETEGLFGFVPKAVSVVPNLVQKVPIIGKVFGTFFFPFDFFSGKVPINMKRSFFHDNPEELKKVSVESNEIVNDLRSEVIITRCLDTESIKIENLLNDYIRSYENNISRGNMATYRDVGLELARIDFDNNLTSYKDKFDIENQASHSNTS